MSDRLALVALCWLTTCGALVFNIQPVLLGALYDRFGYAEDTLGGLMAACLLASFVVLVSAWFWVGRVSPRLAVAGGATVSAIAMLALALTEDARVVTGTLVLLGGGLAAVYAPALVLLGQRADAVAAFGHAITLQVVTASATVYLVPTWLVPLAGFNGIPFFLAGVAVLALLAVPLLPAAASEASGRDQPVAGSTLVAILSLVAMGIYFLGLNGSWAFLERLAALRELDAETVGAALSLALLLGAAGSVAASRLADRLTTFQALLVAVSLFLLYCLFMRHVPGLAGYYVAVILFNVGWNFGLPFQMATVAAADPSGRYVALLPAAQTLGGAAGPALAGLLLVSFGPDSLYLQLLLCAGIACGLAFVTDRRTTARDGSH